MQVERLALGELSFHLGGIDVGELSGELNIGLTHSLRVTPGGQAAAAAGVPAAWDGPQAAPEPETPPAVPVRGLWPPPASGGGTP